MYVKSPRASSSARVSPRDRPPGSEGNSGATSGVVTSLPRGGRLALTLWRPSGVATKEKFSFEVVVDYVSVYKSPMLHSKKPEWFCNFCCDASLGKKKDFYSFCSPPF